MPAFSVNYELAYRQAQETLRGIDPFTAAGNADVAYDEYARDSLAPDTANDNNLRPRGSFFLRYLAGEYVVTFPAGDIQEFRTGRQPALLTKILILHYLTRADGAGLTGQWVNFRQLPGGMMYERTFRAQSIEPIASAFGNDVEAFRKAGSLAGGESARLGDASFLFRVFPRVPLLLPLWLADDELPAAADMLFDAAVVHYLSLEDVDAVGRDICVRLLAFKCGLAK